MDESFYCVFSIKIAKITGHDAEDVIMRNRDEEDTIKQLRTTLNYARISISYETPSQIAVQCTISQVPEIKKILESVQDAVRIFLGIGEELEEAQKAAEFAQYESKSIQMYDAEVKEYMDQKRDGLTKAEGEYTKIDARDKESIKEYLTVIQQSQQTFEQLKQTNPEAYASVVGIVENITNLLIEDKQRQDEDLKQILEHAIKIMNLNEVKVIDKEKFDIHKIIHEHVQDHNEAQSDEADKEASLNSQVEDREYELSKPPSLSDIAPWQVNPNHDDRFEMVEKLKDIILKLEENQKKSPKIVKAETISLETLEKALKPEDVTKRLTPAAQAHPAAVEFANDMSSANVNQNWHDFAIKNFNNNPESWGEHKEDFKHLQSMQHIPAIKDHRFDMSHDLSTGFQAAKEKESKYFQNQESKHGHAELPAKAKTIVNSHDDHSWVNLNQPKCGVEGAAMNHCGNDSDPDKNDKILSLRHTKNKDGKTYSSPKATFIYNKGTIGEMKGKGNHKPSEELHSHIVELLKNPKVKTLVGGGYMANQNFSMDDLSDKDFAEVRQHNPRLVDLSSNKFTDAEKDKALGSLPNVQKIQAVAMKQRNRSKIKQALDQGLDIKQLPARELALVPDHPKMTDKQFDRILKNTHITDVKLAANQMVKDPRFAHKMDDYVKVRPEDAAADKSLHRKLSQDNIDKIVRDAPRQSATYLNDHPLLNAGHVDQIVENSPGAAAAYLNDHPLLNAGHVDRIAEQSPRSAAQYLKDHPLLNAGHIDRIAERDSAAVAAYLKDHPSFNAGHIDRIVENHPDAAAAYLKDHPLLNAGHIDRIVENHPDAAAQYLKDHPHYQAKLRAEYGDR